MKKVLIIAGLLLALNAFVTVYRTQWARDLLSYLDNAETITGEAVWEHGQRKPLSPEQVESVMNIIRQAKLTDNPEFAGTTPDFQVILTVDGEYVLIDSIEVQYHYNGEKRSVSMNPSQNGHGSLQELREEVFPHAVGTAEPAR